LRRGKALNSLPIFSRAEKVEDDRAKEKMMSRIIIEKSKRFHSPLT
jgi:hypothetical protein